MASTGSNIDNDGDAHAHAHADVAFTFTFSEFRHGTQTGTARYAVGDQARQPEPAGEVLIAGTPVGFDAAAQPVQAGPGRLFVGVRSDPFFADADGSFHGFKWTGQDAFANRNILSIVLEVPGDMLGPGPAIGVWATVSVRRDGELVQVDRGGHPTINPFVNPNDVKDQFNVRQPADDVANYLEPWSRLLQDQGGYTPEEARAAALIVLPTSCATTGTGRPPIPTAAPWTMTLSAPDLRGCRTGRSLPRASSRTTTSPPSSPTSARPTGTRPASGERRRR
jgi:hypothetical protein